MNYDDLIPDFLLRAGSPIGQPAAVTKPAQAQPERPEPIRRGWWCAPVGEDQGDPAHAALLEREPPGGMEDFRAKPGTDYLYSRSSAMASYHEGIRIGRIFFTSTRDPSLESWQRGGTFIVQPSAERRTAPIIDGVDVQVL